MKRTTDKRIVVLQGGWVFVGFWHNATDTRPAHLTEAACIRSWGTTAGLGEIALKGPQNATVLDPCGVLLIENPAAVLFTLPCEY